MLANRHPISSLIAGVLLGVSVALKYQADTVMAVAIVSACALMVLTKTSEKKVLIFLAGGFATSIIDLVIYSQSSVVESAAYIAVTVLSTIYLTEILSK